MDEDLRSEREEKFVKAAENERSPLQLTHVWQNIQELLPPGEASEASYMALFNVNWDESWFPSFPIEVLFMKLASGSVPCPFGSFEPFIEFTLARMAGSEDDVLSFNMVEHILAYACKVHPDGFRLFAYDTMEAAMQSDRGIVIGQLLDSTVAVPRDVDSTHLYVQAFQDCCQDGTERKRCMMAFREHIVFKGNSKLITADKLDKMLRSEIGSMSIESLRNIIQAGPALSPGWLLHLAIKNAAIKKPAYSANDSNSAAQRDLWLLQNLLTAAGKPQAGLLSALEGELELKKGGIKAGAVAVSAAQVGPAAVKAGVGAHLHTANVPGMLAAVLAWLVRLSLQPHMHPSAHALLASWRTRGDSGAGEAAALKLFEAALAAAPTGGYTYKALKSPAMKPWWLFHVELNAEENDCYSEFAAGEVAS